MLAEGGLHTWRPRPRGLSGGAAAGGDDGEKVGGVAVGRRVRAERPTAHGSDIEHVARAWDASVRLHFQLWERLPPFSLDFDHSSLP